MYSSDRRMPWILTLLIALRFGWAVLPQNGYIHPDEFFQTVEIIAGDTLNISVVRTWEFTSSYPLRSMVLPQLTFSPIFKLLRHADEKSSFHMAGYHLISSYRLVMTILSLWIDTCIYKICKIIGLQGYTANILFASSFVTLTFQTHTFSNSFETVLFTTLMLLVLMCMKKEEESNSKKRDVSFWSEIDKNKGAAVIGDENKTEKDLESSFNYLHNMSFDLRKRNKETDLKIKRVQRDKEDLNKCKDCEVNSESQSSDEQRKRKWQHTDQTESRKQISLYAYICLIAVTVTIGVFNRPTFVIFTLLPLLWWTDKYHARENNIIMRVTVFIFTSLVLSIIFVTIDTAYFNDIEIASIFTDKGLRKILDSLVITPLNFFMYNSMITNLETHGRHPFYIHMFVNMPLLFGPMLMYLSKHMLSKIIVKLKALKRSNTIGIEKKVFSELNVSVEEKLKTFLKEAICPFVFFPVIVLSFFPHQECRFLIPLLPLVVISVVLFCDKPGKIFWITLTLFNISLSVVFGTLHQGGVIPCLLKLQQLTETEFMKSNTSLTVIFSHTYMPPKHLLLTRTQNLELLDFKGADLQTVFNETEKCRHSVSNSTNSSNKYVMKRVFLVLPGTLVSEFKSKYNKLLRFKLEEKFFPHLSLEDPPTKFVDTFKTYDDMSLHLTEIEE